jgi:hypothetical protein
MSIIARLAICKTCAGTQVASPTGISMRDSIEFVRRGGNLPPGLADRNVLAPFLKGGAPKGRGFVPELTSNPVIPP